HEQPPGAGVRPRRALLPAGVGGRPRRRRPAAAVPHPDSRRAAAPHRRPDDDRPRPEGRLNPPMTRPLILLGASGNALDILDVVDAVHARQPTWRVFGLPDAGPP